MGGTILASRRHTAARPTIGSAHGVTTPGAAYTSAGQGGIDRPRAGATDRTTAAHSARPSARGLSHAIKRGLDVALAGAGLAALSPLMVAVAAAVRLDSRGGAIFAQRRVGLHGEEFVMYKFRTMHHAAERSLAQLAHHNEADGPLFKLTADPRITRVGKFLRSTSLDELPQLVNVLRGHMSLVGPRPALPSEVSTYDERARRRLHVKPGLTGPWQVGGRSDLSWEEGLSLDLGYVDGWSITGDFRLLAATVQAVASRKGAY